MNLIKLTTITVLTLFLVGNAWAETFGTNITIPDGNSYGTGWYSDREDNEVEPNMVRRQRWDLEGFFMKDSTLSVVGGFDFKNGVPGSYTRAGSDGTWTGGDLFISTSQKPVYGDIHNGPPNGVRTVSNTYGYDYVLDIDYDDLTYDLLAIDAATMVQTPYFHVNEGSSPWLYDTGGLYKNSGGVLIDQVDTTGIFSGDLYNNQHYMMSLDLSYLYGLLDPEDGLYFHYTMECGNDNLMGYYPVASVPEPATMLLLGTGLLGMAGIVRKKSKS